jgi:preprotein translocase subunit YajC
MIVASSLFVAQAGPSSGGLVGMVPFVLVLFIFYFLVIRPNQTEQRDHASLLASLKKDDRIATTGGLHGKIVEVKEHLVVLEIADRVRVIIDKPSVKRRLEEAGAEKAPDKTKPDAQKGA